MVTKPILIVTFALCGSLLEYTQLIFYLSQVVALTKQTDLTERQIERWWRYRRAQVS